MSIEIMLILLWFAGQLIVAAAVWGAIRQDIKGIHKSVGILFDAQKAVTERMDNLMLGLHSVKKG